MDVYRYSCCDVDRQRPLRRHRCQDVAEKIYSARLRILYFQSGPVFRLDAELSPAQKVWIGRAFYVWVSVFNLFVTAIFWAFMTDLFTVEQGKTPLRLYRVGGSLGAIFGAYITKRYVPDIGPAKSPGRFRAILFGLASFLVKFFPGGFTARDEPARNGRRKSNRRMDLVRAHPHRPFALPAWIGGFDAHLHIDFDLGLFSTIGSGPPSLEKRQSTRLSSWPTSIFG